MIKSFVDTLAAHIDTYWEGMLVYLKDVSGIIGGLCGLAALLYIGNKVWSSYARGESIDIYSLLRPFVIGLVCANFNVIVIGGIRGLADPICDYFEGLESQTSEMEQTASFSQAVQDAQKKAAKLQEALDNQQAEDKGFWSRLSDRFNFGNFMQNIKNYLFVIFGWAFQFIADLLASLTKFVLLFTRCFSLSVLCLLGPIIFAGSIFPGFKQGLIQWIARFVCIYFWVPLFSICDIFLNTVRAAIANNMLTNITTQLNSVVDITDNLSPEKIEAIAFQLQGIEANVAIIGSLISILTAVLYKSVPTLASWIIAGGDSSGNLASVAGFAAGASAIAGAGAAALTGMAAKGVTSGVRQAGGAVGAGLAKAGQKIRSGGNGGGTVPSAHMGIGPRDMGIGGSARTPVGFKQGGVTASTAAAAASKAPSEEKQATTEAAPMTDDATTTALWRSVVGNGLEHAGRSLRAPHLKHAMRFGNDRQRYAAASDRYASHGVLRMAANDNNEYVQLAAANHAHASVSTLRRAARYGYASAAGKAAERLLQRGQKVPEAKGTRIPSIMTNVPISLSSDISGANVSASSAASVKAGDDVVETTAGNADAEVMDAGPMAAGAAPTALWRSVVGSGLEHAGRSLRAPHLKHAMRFGNDRQRYAAASDRYASHGILRMAANDINEYVQLAAANHAHASVSTLRRAARYGYASAAGKATERLLQRGQKAPAGAFVNMPSMVHNAMFNLLYMPDAGQQPTTI